MASRARLKRTVALPQFMRSLDCISTVTWDETSDIHEFSQPTCDAEPRGNRASSSQHLTKWTGEETASVLFFLQFCFQLPDERLKFKIGDRGIHI